MRAFDYFGSHDYPGEHAGVIYLRTQPKTCAEHICERARVEETTVPLEYLERLHAQHKRAINDSSETWRGAERLVLDVEQLGRINDDDEAADRCARKLARFITKERDGDESDQRFIGPAARHEAVEPCSIA